MLLKFVGHQASMAIQAVVVLAMLVLASSYVKAQQNCNRTSQCKLLPIGRDVVFRFKKLATEKGVRLTYLHLEFGKGSYNPLESNERFFAKRWVWAKTTKEPMLSLPEDYDIHSLGLFKYQVRHLKVPLEEQPSGCLANLSTSCQDEIVGRTLLINFTNVYTDNRFFQAIPEDCMCTLHIVESTELKTVCCSVQNFTETNGPLVHCESPAKPFWFQMITIQTVFYVILSLYCPALPLLLPDSIFNLQNECEEEKKTKYIRDYQVLPDQQNDNEQNGIELSTRVEVCSSEENSYNGRGRNATVQFSSVFPLSLKLKPSPDKQNEVEQRESRDEEDSDQEEDKSPNEGTLNREIPLDDVSPITICALLSDCMEELPAFKVNFNLKLLFLCFVVLPSLFYLKLSLILCYKMDLYHEFAHKLSIFPAYCKVADLPDLIVCKIAGLSFKQILTFSNTLTLIGFVTTFVILLCIRPTALLYPNKVSYFCFLKRYCKPVSLGDEMLKHFKVLHHFAYNLMFHKLWKYVNVLQKCLVKCVDRCRIKSIPLRLLRSLCYVFPCFVIALSVGLVFGIISVFLFLLKLCVLLVLLSPTATLFVFVLNKSWELICHFTQPRIHVCLLILPLSCLSAIILIPAFSLVTSLVFVSAGFTAQFFILTLMGLVLNAEVVTPYVAFILVVTKNLHLCYCNLQNRYKEVKGMISEQWKESTEGLPWLDNSNDETISEDLFWFVCGKGELSYKQNVIPLRAELCRMLRNIAIIVVFLCLSLFAILIFKSVNDISVLVSTIFVFVSGVIPSLIFEGLTRRQNFSGWKKINMKKKIKEAVKEYLRTMKEDDDDGGYEIINESDDHRESDDCFGVCLNLLLT